MAGETGDEVLDRITRGIRAWEGVDGLGADWSDDGDEPERIADLVLSSLGLEHVGWYNTDDGVHEGSGEGDDDRYCVMDECSRVYRLRPEAQ